MTDALQVHQLSPEQRAALGLTAPSPWFVTGSDGLQVSSWNSLAGVTLTIVGRFRTLDGEDRPFVFTQTPNTNRTIASTVFPLGDGWLLNVAAFVSAGAPIIGQTFVRLQIVRGLVSSGLAMGTLTAGYVTAVQPLAWPGSLVQSSLDGGGALRSIAGSVPGAGAEISETVPTGARWELLAFRATLTTSAAAANRLATLTMDDGATVYGQFPSGVNAVASFPYPHTWGEGLTRFADLNASAVCAGVPVNNRLLAGHRLRTVTLNIQAGDQWSAIQYLVREWLECAA